MAENVVELIVTKSCCPLYREGDKVVFSGARIDKEKSGNLCMTALAAVYPFVYAARKGTVRENPLHCPDCADGVEFKLEIQKPAPSSDKEDAEPAASLTEVCFPADAEDERIGYSVIAARFQNRWVYCKHKERDTLEIPGGHREKGETPEQAARRELYEETGAKSFSLVPVCVYSVKERRGAELCETFGMLYFAEIDLLGPMPDFEMESVCLYGGLPDRLTYPMIQPELFRKAESFLARQSRSDQL